MKPRQSSLTFGAYHSLRVRVAAAVKANPKRPNAAIAAEYKVDSDFVAAVKRDFEKKGEIR